MLLICNLLLLSITKQKTLFLISVKSTKRKKEKIGKALSCHDDSKENMTSCLNIDICVPISLFQSKFLFAKNILNQIKLSLLNEQTNLFWCVCKWNLGLWVSFENWVEIKVEPNRNETYKRLDFFLFGHHETMKMNLLNFNVERRRIDWKEIVWRLLIYKCMKTFYFTLFNFFLTSQSCERYNTTNSPLWTATKQRKIKTVFGFTQTN